MKSKDLLIVLTIIAITALASFFVFTIANKWSSDETENTITVERSNGRLTIGKNFIIKIENWRNQRGDFSYK